LRLRVDVRPTLLCKTVLAVKERLTFVPRAYEIARVYDLDPGRMNAYPGEAELAASYMLHDFNVLDRIVVESPLHTVHHVVPEGTRRTVRILVANHDSCSIHLPDTSQHAS
jgi:hypothetical protein